MQSFPARPALAWHLALRALPGLQVRHACDDDVPWLQVLYASSRSTELQAVPWPDSAKSAFLQSQFDLQHQHFLQAYPDAQWWVVQVVQPALAATPIGRFYWHAGAHGVTVVDICLLPHWQNKGVGTALLQYAMQQATQRLCTVTLHVAHANSNALRLYLQLGFTVEEDVGSHMRMRWLPAVGSH